MPAPPSVRALARARDLPPAIRPPGGRAAGPDLPVVPPIADIAAGLAAARLLWETEVRHDPERRFFTRLLETEAYDAWLIGWWPGQGVPLHDHGGSAGAVVVVEGRLHESHLVDGAGVRTRAVAAGGRITFGSGHVHSVANVDDVPATSIHVYSPPLRTMGHYEEGADGPSVVRVEAIDGAPSHAESLPTPTPTPAPAPTELVPA